MRVKCQWRSILVASVLQQWPNMALVVDLDGLLGSGRMVAGRRGLEDKAIDSGEDEELPGYTWHLLCARQWVSV